jgi:phage head maturation protease
MSSLNFFGEIEKTEQQADGTIIVSGYASTEDRDSQGEIVLASAMKAALPDYMKFANIREMHQPKAAGTTVEAAVQDDGRTWIKAHIVDSEAVKKVQNKVYKGFSIGGRVTGRDEANKSTITSFTLSEISLVDRPANPEAVLACWKADGVQPEAEAEAAPEKQQEEEKEPEAGKEEVSTDKAESTETQKGMFAVSRLAELIDGLAWLQECCSQEAAIEGDKSKVPAQLLESVKGLSSALQSMVAEETAELTAGKEETGDEAAMAMADKAEDLQKAGARHSKADMDKLQAIHDHSAAMGAACGGDEKMHKADADTLQKIADLEATLEKITSDNKEMAERIKQLEADPEPLKGQLKVVEKGDDATLSAEQETAPKDTTSLIKKIHQSGGRPLF